MIEQKLVDVTPAKAEAWLQHNVENRPLRESTVEGLKAAYQRGEYVITHQGVAFDEDGNLIDGQHRLTAISQMPAGFVARMYVTTGLSKKAFKAIDIGSKRTAGDVLRVNQGLAAVARYMAVLNDHRHSSITPQLLVPYIEGISAVYEKLVAFSPTVTKTWSSAAVRAAACLQMLNGGDKDYICISYYALNHAEFTSMSPIVQALYRQQVRGLVRGKAVDMFCRSFKAFDTRSQSLNTIQISDTSTIVGKAREIVNAKVLGEKSGASGPAPKKVNSAKFTKATANA